MLVPIAKFSRMASLRTPAYGKISQLFQSRVIVYRVVEADRNTAAIDRAVTEKLPRSVIFIVGT